MVMPSRVDPDRKEAQGLAAGRAHAGGMTTALLLYRYERGATPEGLDSPVPDLAAL
jgi:hypothetical protein